MGRDCQTEYPTSDADSSKEDNYFCYEKKQAERRRRRR